MKQSLLFALTLMSVALLTSTKTKAQTPIFNPGMTITSLGSVNSPAGEDVGKIIDGLTTTKFLDFNDADGMGFTVDLGGTPAVARILEMTTANDFAERDPQNFEVLGSNDGVVFTSVTTGTIPCISARGNTRSFNFVNNTSYLHYRVNYTNKCGGGTIFQVAETQLYSIVCGTPITGSQTLNECDGFSVTVGTNTYNSTGIYTDILLAADGCDSTVTTDLTIRPVSIVNAAPVFDCDSAQINGNWYFTTQTVTDFYPLAASNGCDSTVITPLTISNLTGSVTSDICTDGSMIINGNTYDATNTTGTEVFLNVGPNSCDSTVTINLNVVSENIDLSIINTSPTFAANQTGATYQWINCNDNNSFIVGETNRNFTATNSGDYAVIITIGSCSDTSACQSVLIANVNENSFETEALLFPNPTTGDVNVNFGKSLSHGSITVVDLTGKNVFEIQDINNQSILLNVNDLSKGFYFVQIQNNGQQKTVKLIKE